MSKKQLLSSQTVLLRGAGRTNIEYSAGPNINITDDVISGRDWSQEMAEIVKGGVSASLSGGDNIQITNDQGINIISVTGDLYSAGPNIDITDRTISGKDWTDDIDSHIASAISGKADSSAIPEIVEYSAGDNINITDHVVSGKDWTYEIGQKVGRDEFVSGMSAVTEHMTEVVSSTSGDIINIISATSGAGGCPWISGGKDYGSATVQLDWGSVLPVFSSWDLSGDHNHYIWFKGAYIRMPEIASALSGYLDLSSFSSYTANTYNWLSSINALANSAYTTAVNNYHNKLDISAWSAFTADADTTPYSAGNGIDITDHVISFTGSEGQTYSAGDNINITDNVISGKSWTDEIIAAVSGKQPSGDYYSASNPSGFITSAGTVNKLDISSFTAYTAAHSGDDNQAYSAGQNINITDHVVSGKDWSNEIASSTSGKLDASWTAGKDVTPYSAGSNINVTNHVISGKDWTQTIDEHIESAISGIETPSAKPVSGTSGIKIQETDDAVIFSISGDVGKTYSAGSNIYISNQNVISGRDWSTNITSATSGKLDSSWTAGKDVTPYSAGSNINITNHVVSGKDWTTEITSATSGKADKSEIPTIVDYSAGANIDVTDHVISGKDWTDDITAAVESATSGKQDTLIFNYDGDNNISAINGSALAGLGGNYSSQSGTLIFSGDNAEASISGLQWTTHYVDSAVNINREVINSVPSTSEPYKILNNIISGVMSAQQYGTELEYATSALIKDSDGNTLTSFVIPRLDNLQSYTIPYTSTSAGNSLWIKASNYYIGNAYYIGAVYSSVPTTGYRVVDLYNNYSAGSGITIVDHVINASGHEYIAGSGIEIYDDVISVTAGGKTYQGIAPVVVDNDLDTVSLGSATWSLSAGTGITLTPNSSVNTLVIAATNTADPNNYVLKNSVQCPIGSNITADATAFGQGATVKVQSASFGQGNAVSAIGSAFAQGKSVKVQSASFGQGASLDVSGDSFAQGYNITAKDHAFAQGENETVSGYSFAQGIWSRAFDMSFAQGFNPYASAYSFAQGSNTVAVCAGQAFGIGTQANGCMAIGKYNSTSADAAFVIGNGESLNSRGDLFVIDNSGNVHAPLGYFYDADGKVGGGSGDGNKIIYSYSTPATSYSSRGDMVISYQTSQSTPARTTVFVNDSAVGLLAPNTVNHNSFLMQDQRGSTTWVDSSAVVPSSMSAQASYFSKTYTTADSGDSCIPDYPEMNRDWTFNVINWKDTWIYYSAMQGTATLAPGMGVRIHYDVDSDWLDAEPEYSAGGIGMKYLTDVDIQFVPNSAYATESGVLYIITG